MIALGLSLLASLAAAPPPALHVAGEKVASTWDEAACDAGDGGECADEIVIDLVPAPAAILDCQSPFIAEMIGSCDLPAATLPSLHLPTLQRGGPGLNVVQRVGDKLTFVTTPPSLEAALPPARLPLAPCLHATPLSAHASALLNDAPPFRLDRPPRG